MAARTTGALVGGLLALVLCWQAGPVLAGRTSWSLSLGTDRGRHCRCYPFRHSGHPGRLRESGSPWWCAHCMRHRGPALDHCPRCDWMLSSWRGYVTCRRCDVVFLLRPCRRCGAPVLAAVRRFQVDDGRTESADLLFSPSPSPSSSPPVPLTLPYGLPLPWDDDLPSSSPPGASPTGTGAGRGPGGP